MNLLYTIKPKVETQESYNTLMAELEAFVAHLNGRSSRKRARSVTSPPKPARKRRAIPEDETAKLSPPTETQSPPTTEEQTNADFPVLSAVDQMAVDMEPVIMEVDNNPSSEDPLPTLTHETWNIQRIYALTENFLLEHPKSQECTRVALAASYYTRLWNFRSLCREGQTLSNSTF